MTKPLTVEQTSSIITRYKQGESAIDLARAFDVSKRTIYNVFEKAGVDRNRAMHFLTDDEIAVIVARYNAGESAFAISKDYSASHATICNVLHRRGIETRPELVTPTITAKQKRLALEACMSGTTVPAAADLAGISPETVFKLLKQEGLRLAKGRPNPHVINHDAFDVLTPEVLYWMGFLFTDGCVHKDEGATARIIIGLAEVDRGHLEKLRSFLGASHPVRRVVKNSGYGGGPAVYFAVRSKKLTDALVAQGFVKKRTRAPSEALIASRDFWRGCVDGDGSVGVSRHMARRPTYPEIMLCGQIPLLESFQKFLRVNNLAALNYCPTGSGIHKIATSGSTAYAIVKVLYQDATVALDRKLERAKLILSGEHDQIVSYKKKPRRTT